MAISLEILLEVTRHDLLISLFDPTKDSYCLTTCAHFLLCSSCLSIDSRNWSISSSHSNTCPNKTKQNKTKQNTLQFMRNKNTRWSDKNNSNSFFFSFTFQVCSISTNISITTLIGLISVLSYWNHAGSLTESRCSDSIHDTLIYQRIESDSLSLEIANWVEVHDHQQTLFPIKTCSTNKIFSVCRIFKWYVDAFVSFSLEHSSHDINKSSRSQRFTKCATFTWTFVFQFIRSIQIDFISGLKKGIESPTTLRIFFTRLFQKKISCRSWDWLLKFEQF